MAEDFLAFLADGPGFSADVQEFVSIFGGSSRVLDRIGQEFFSILVLSANGQGFLGHFWQIAQPALLGKLRIS